MKRSIIFFLFLPFFWACNTGKEEAPPSENDVDAARNFINAALKGNYETARAYILPDSTNNQFLDAFERQYQKNMSPDEKRSYREATIKIHQVRPVNDSVSVVTYSNSYKKKQDSLKVVNTKGEWLVDFKYSFQSATVTPK